MNIKHLFIFFSFFFAHFSSLKSETIGAILKNLPANTVSKDLGLPAAPKQREPLILAEPEDEREKELPVVNKPTPALQKEELTKKEFNKKLVEQEQKFRFYFEDATLANVVKYIETLFKVTFLPDDAITPLMAGALPLNGHKITFKTNKPLSRQEAWNVFLKLLDLAGLTIVPGSTPQFYRITSVTGANQEALPTYFDINLKDVPDNAAKIRYIYFVKNSSLATIQNLVTALASQTAKILTFPDLNALIIIDKGNNVRSLMNIIQELDKDTPEAMSVLKLKKTDATKVAALYGSLTQTSGGPGAARSAQQRKQPGNLYFSNDARIIPEPRTNRLILLGPKKDLAKIENFIIKHIDTDLDMPYSPLHVHRLENTDATNITTILQKVIGFGSSTAAGAVGGIRDGQKFFKAGSITIVPEPVGNWLIIRAEDDDFEKLVEIINVLDVEQPQVAIEVLIVDVSASNTKELKAQIRNESDGSFIKNTNFQSAQIGSPQTNGTDGSLIANLISLATGAANGAGTTLLSIGGAASGGVWGIFKILKTYTNAKIIENPFLVATNKYQASFVYGKTRRVLAATVGEGGQSFGDKSANLTLKVTPQINSDGLITMSIDLIIQDFTNESSEDNANTTTNQITTSVQIKDQDVLALGGIVKNRISTVVTKVPLLGDIPLLGNLFRGKVKEHVVSNLMIFLSPRIIIPSKDYHIENYTHNKTEEIKETLSTITTGTVSRDPIDKMFFEYTNENDYQATFDDFMEPEMNDTPGRKETSQKTLKQHKKEAKKYSSKKNSHQKRLARKREQR